MSHPSYPIPPLSTNFAAVPGPAGIPPPPPCQPPSFSLAPVPAPAPSPVVVVVAAARIGTSSARLPTSDSAPPTRREGDTWQALPLPSTGRAAKKKAPGHRDASAAGHGPEQGQPAVAVKFKMVRLLCLLTILLAHPHDIEKVQLRIFVLHIWKFIAKSSCLRLQKLPHVVVVLLFIVAVVLQLGAHLSKTQDEVPLTGLPRDLRSS